jgi:hypothetical protein
LGFMGLNGPAHDFFLFFITSKPRNKYQMYSNLKTFDTIRFYKSWAIFLKIFIDFFIFWIQIQIWKFVAVATARYRYRTPAVTTVTAVTRAVTSGKKTLPTSQRVESCGAILSIRKHVSLHIGPRESNTYKLADLKQRKSCNGIFANRRIVIVYLQTTKVVMSYI